MGTLLRDFRLPACINLSHESNILPKYIVQLLFNSLARNLGFIFDDHLTFKFYEQTSAVHTQHCLLAISLTLYIPLKFTPFAPVCIRPCNARCYCYINDTSQIMVNFNATFVWIIYRLSSLLHMHISDSLKLFTTAATSRSARHLQ